MAVREIPIADLEFDEELQSRVGLNLKVASDYADAMSEGTEFPPLVIFDDGKQKWVADGFHRGAAARMAGRKVVPCEVRTGTRRDAVFHAIGSNASHGLRRSDDDKRRAVLMVLSDPEWRQMSTNAIRKHVGVSQHLVNRMRRENPNLDSDVRIGANGVPYQMPRRTPGKLVSAMNDGMVVGAASPQDQTPRLTLWRDETGAPIPSGIRESYSGIRWTCSEAHEMIGKAIAKLSSLEGVPAASGVPVGELVQSLLLIADTVKGTFPHAVCPEYGDDHRHDCQVCGGCGFIGRDAAKSR